MKWILVNNVGSIACKIDIKIIEFEGWELSIQVANIYMMITPVDYDDVYLSLAYIL